MFDNVPAQHLLIFPLRSIIDSYCVLSTLLHAACHVVYFCPISRERSSSWLSLICLCSFAFCKASPSPGSVGSFFHVTKIICDMSVGIRISVS